MTGVARTRLYFAVLLIPCRSDSRIARKNCRNLRDDTEVVPYGYTEIQAGAERPLTFHFLLLAYHLLNHVKINNLADIC